MRSENVVAYRRIMWYNSKDRVNSDEWTIDILFFTVSKFYEIAWTNADKIANIQENIGNE